MKVCNSSKFNSNNSSGFTLIEVLVAVVVFSFGLLGIAGMMTIAVKSNHNGFMRTQANFLAENMMDRMRANPTAVWNGFYDGTPVVANTQPCALTAPCDYEQLATYDTEAWARSLAQFLPAGQGQIACVANTALDGSITGADAPSIWFPAPPYDGVCTITIQWNESNRESANSAQILTLIGTP